MLLSQVRPHIDWQPNDDGAVGCNSPWQIDTQPELNDVCAPSKIVKWRRVFAENGGYRHKITRILITTKKS